MNTQQAYEQMRSYFTQPSARIAKDERGECVYRDPRDGAKCAFGCLIPDTLYTTMIEGLSVETLIGPDAEEYRHDGLAEAFKDVNLTFLDLAQTRHDWSDTAENFVIDLDNLAEDFGLKLVRDA